MVPAAACVYDLLASKCDYLNAFILSNEFPILLDTPDVKWSEMSYGEVLGDKIAMHIRVSLYWGYLFILWLFHLGISCTVFV